MSDFDAVLITGPTASGKSALAVDWARRTGGVVINADSMQVYDTLRVLTARPSDEDMQGIPHLLYGHVPSARLYSTGAWLRDVGEILGRLRGENRMPIIVGGTGLYFKALTEGLADMPDIPGAIRDSVRLRLQEEGPEALHAALSTLDPATAERLNPQDGQRIARAVEVFEASGKPLSHFQQQMSAPLLDSGKVRKLVVLPDRMVLAERINRRFDAMLAGEAIEEVRALMALGLPDSLPVMRAIGVPEIRSYLNGTLPLSMVAERGAAATRQYAKRQMTWFRNQMDASWERIAP